MFGIYARNVIVKQGRYVADNKGDEMNAIDKRKMAEGVLYNFHFSHSADNNVVDFAVAVKDLARQYGLTIAANKYGQLEIRDREMVEKARTFVI